MTERAGQERTDLDRIVAAAAARPEQKTKDPVKLGTFKGALPGAKTKRSAPRPPRGAVRGRQQESIAAESSRRRFVAAGVFVPTTQNIMGIILFVRVPFIVGEAGVVEALGIVWLSCLTAAGPRERRDAFQTFKTSWRAAGR